MIDVAPIVTWLVEGAQGASTSVGVVAKLGPDLRAAGVPVERVEAFVRTLHPHIAGRSFVWVPDAPVVVRENSYADFDSAAFLANPAAEVFRTRQPARRRRADGSLTGELGDAGYTDFVAHPMRFLSGEVHAISFATRAPGGFSEPELAALAAVLPPLSRIAEILALARTAANLLNTYVGHNAGERILAGQIQRGDTQSLRAVLWFSDLRGYTALSSELQPGGVIRMLNELFDCQVPAIERQGGEVLKFMGDGLLAIFSLAAGDDAARRCDQALSAAGEAFDALGRLNLRRLGAGETPLQFGVALHVGEVSYGNIGGSGRLDFTCIGPAVNLVSRLEGMTAKLERPLVVSDAFAKLTTRPTTFVGHHELKGVPGLTEVFAP